MKQCQADILFTNKLRNCGHLQASLNDPWSIFGLLVKQEQGPVYMSSDVEAMSCITL